MNMWKMKLTMGLMCAILFGASMAFAQEESAAPAAPRTMLEAGGEIGYIIILLSIVGLALTIELAVTLRRDKLCPRKSSATGDAVAGRGIRRGSPRVRSRPKSSHQRDHSRSAQAASLRSHERYRQEAMDEEALKLFRKSATFRWWPRWPRCWAAGHRDRHDRGLRGHRGGGQSQSRSWPSVFPRRW